MNQTLAQIERYVTEAFDHLTVALEPVEWSELTEGEEPGRRDFAPYLIACL